MPKNPTTYSMVKLASSWDKTTVIFWPLRDILILNGYVFIFDASCSPYFICPFWKHDLDRPHSLLIRFFLSATVVTVRKTGNGQPMTPLRDFWRSLAHFWKVSIKGRDHFWKLHSHLFTRKLVSRIVISKNAKIAIAMALALNRCIFRYRLVCLKLYSTFVGWPSVNWPVDSLFFSSIGLINTGNI